MPMMIKTCPKCGWKNPEEQGNCLYCSRALNDVVPEEEAPPKKPGLFDFQAYPEATVCKKRGDVFKWRVAVFVCLISIIILIEIAISSDSSNFLIIGGVIAALFFIGIPLSVIKAVGAPRLFWHPTPREFAKKLTIKKSKRFIVENKVINALVAITVIAVIMVVIHYTVLIPNYTIRLSGTDGVRYNGQYGRFDSDDWYYERDSGNTPFEYTIKAFPWVEVAGRFRKVSGAGVLKVQIIKGNELLDEVQTELINSYLEVSSDPDSHPYYGENI